MAGKTIDRVVIRPLSSVIYFYPSMLAAVIAGLVMTWSPATPAEPGITGLLFTLTFFFNLAVVAFDFTRLASVVIVMAMVIVGLLSALYPQIWGAIQSVLDQPMFMNATFYWFWAAGFAVILLAVLVKARFDYWEIRNNELLHHHGFLGDVERWPAPEMRITKEIKDVMEYALCRAGRLVLMPARESRAIVLDNVPFISRVEAKMQTLLNTLKVDDVDKAA